MESALSYPVLRLVSDHDDLNRAFRIALGDLASSTVLHASRPCDEPIPIILAGLDYDDPWTRDAAINCWNAASLLAPPIARSTLLGVLEKAGGAVTIRGQYWDKVIWITGAWHHYLVTGDGEFLTLAARASKTTLEELERNEFDGEKGLFRGGACFQDGISGYPDRYVRGHESSGPITRWAETNPKERAFPGVGLPMMAGSTNCLYYSAYRCMGQMSRQLDLPGASSWDEKAARLRRSIRQQLWDTKTARLAYMIDPWETCRYQEGLGLSFALLFGILEEEEAARAIASSYLTPHGIPCVWPTFPRYETPGGNGFGRHSGTVWPHVQGFWAEAVARNGRADLLLRELLLLAAHAVRDRQFTEIYHPVNGTLYGGLQERPHPDEVKALHGTPFPLPRPGTAPATGVLEEWRSCRRQTWSATAFLRMVLSGVLGLRFDLGGVSFTPTLSNPVASLRIDGLPYRRAVLDIELAGSGQTIQSFHVNGAPAADGRIPADARGRQLVQITLG